MSMNVNGSNALNNTYGKGLGIPVNIKSKADQYIKVRDKGAAKPYDLKVVNDGYLSKRGLEALKSQQERGVKEIIDVPEVIQEAIRNTPGIDISL